MAKLCSEALIRSRWLAKQFISTLHNVVCKCHPKFKKQDHYCKCQTKTVKKLFERHGNKKGGGYLLQTDNRKEIAFLNTC
uniref:Uncharacterized protein n=1 Tax=Ixodes ricinus TaxID=34613 RepID=A0A6B0TW01_IXORI